MDVKLHNIFTYARKSRMNGMQEKQKSVGSTSETVWSGKE
jgi:hypothetical protein